MKRTILFILLVSLVATSCRQIFGKRVHGNGDITTVSRDASGYKHISVSSSINVYVRQDSAQSVKVVTDDNLQSYVTVREEGGVLYIGMQKGYNLKPTNKIKVYVTGPEFRKFEASGACNIYTENRVTSSESIAIRMSGSSDADMDLKAPRVVADLTGAGSIVLKGETKNLELDGTGSSDLKCFDMMAENVNVDITGSGDAEVFASVKLDIHVTGAGSVKYRGNASVNQKVSGAGSVKKID